MVGCFSGLQSTFWKKAVSPQNSCLCQGVRVSWSNPDGSDALGNTGTGQTTPNKGPNKLYHTLKKPYCSDPSWHVVAKSHGCGCSRFIWHHSLSCPRRPAEAFHSHCSGTPQLIGGLDCSNPLVLVECKWLDCYWVGSLDFNFWGNQGGVSTKPSKSDSLFAGESTATKMGNPFSTTKPPLRGKRHLRSAMRSPWRT